MGFVLYSLTSPTGVSSWVDETTLTATPTGPAGGDLSGTYPNPAVSAITETGGPTQLTVAGITDGQFLIRSGATITSAIAGDVFGPGGAVVANRLALFNASAGTPYTIDDTLLTYGVGVGYVSLTVETPNGAFVLAPNGTGALQAQVADSGIGGGNTRGVNAVDLQFTRTVNTQVASGARSVVIGGQRNTASGPESGVVGGYGTAATGDQAVAFGGVSSLASGDQSGVIGGDSITASQTQSFVGGGKDSTASGARSAVVGGFSNIASGGDALSSGRNNDATNTAAACVGGDGNTASGLRSVNVGGTSLTASGQDSGCFAGSTSTNSATGAVVLGGVNHTIDATAPYAAIAGAGGSRVQSDYNFIGGGHANSIGTSSDDAAIVGGHLNNVLNNSGASFIGGGYDCNINGSRSGIIGGYQCDITGGVIRAFIGAGSLADVETSYAVSLGGVRTNVTAEAAVALGGYNTKADTKATVAWSGSRGSTGSDAQRGKSQAQLVHLDLTSTTAAAGQNMQPGTDSGVVINTDSAHTFTGTVTVFDTTATDVSSWTVNGVIENDSGTPTVKASNITNLIDEVAGGGVVSISVVVVASTTDYWTIAVDTSGGAGTTNTLRCSAALTVSRAEA